MTPSHTHRDCLDAVLGGQLPGDGSFAPGNGGRAIPNDDIPQLQTRLWTIAPDNPRPSWQRQEPMPA